MLEIVYTNKMKRDVRLMEKRGKDISKLTAALALLASIGAEMKITTVHSQYNTTHPVVSRQCSCLRQG